MPKSPEQPDIGGEVEREVEKIKESEVEGEKKPESILETREDEKITGAFKKLLDNTVNNYKGGEYLKWRSTPPGARGFWQHAQFLISPTIEEITMYGGTKELESGWNYQLADSLREYDPKTFDEVMGKINCKELAERQVYDVQRFPEWTGENKASAGVGIVEDYALLRNLDPELYSQRFPKEEVVKEIVEQILPELEKIDLSYYVQAYYNATERLGLSEVKDKLPITPELWQRIIAAIAQEKEFHPDTESSKATNARRRRNNFLKYLSHVAYAQRIKPPDLPDIAVTEEELKPMSTKSKGIGKLPWADLFKYGLLFQNMRVLD